MRINCFEINVRLTSVIIFAGMVFSPMPPSEGLKMLVTDRHDSTESGSPESHFNRNYEKVPFASGDQLLTGRDGTLLCSAGPEWYGYLGIIDTEASTWAPAVGRPSKSAGCLAAQKKNLVVSPEERQLGRQLIRWRKKYCSVSAKRS